MVKRITLLLIVVLILLSFRFSREVRSQSAPNINPNVAYVLGEVIVEYQPGEDPVTIQNQVDTRQQRAKFGFGKIQNLQEDATAALSGESKPEEKLATLNAVKVENQVTQETYVNDNIFSYQSSANLTVEQIMTNFLNNPLVKNVSPNYLLQLLSTPNDLLYSRQWALTQMGFDKAWYITTGSRNTKVAIIDSGSQLTHPDLTTNLIENKVIDGADSNFLSPHGTHVAGIIGATTNNNLGIAGSNHSVSLLSLKSDSLVDTDKGKQHGLKLDVVARAIDYAISQNVDIINMSIGAPIDDPILRAAVNNAYNQGIAIIAASGNTGRREIYYPAGYNNVISVGTVGPDDRL